MGKLYSRSKVQRLQCLGREAVMRRSEYAHKEHAHQGHAHQGHAHQETGMMCVLSGFPLFSLFSSGAFRLQDGAAHIRDVFTLVNPFWKLPHKHSLLCTYQHDQG